MASNIQFKRGTAAALYAANPVLLRGEPGLEIDTNKIKYGNGVTPWRDLPYGNPALEVVDGGEFFAPSVPAVPGVFTPPTLDGLVLWLDANDPDYTHKVNNRLSMWEDLSETRAQFFQSNKANRPSMVNQIAEEDVVTFDGVNDAMLGNFALPAEFTLLVALRRRGSSTNGKLLTAYSANSATELVLCGTETGNSIGVSDGEDFYATQPVDDLVPAIYTLQFSEDGFSTRLNGLNTQADTMVSAAAKTVMAIGGDRVDFSADNFGGDVAEIVMYDRVLTAADLLDAENYMMERWGIVQVSHPLLEGMKAFWPLNEETGNRIDITDAEIPLTPTGAVGFEAGVVGNAANLTGAANYLTAPTSFTLTGSFSVSLWFKPDAVTGSAPQIVQNWAGGMQGQMVLGFGDEGNETGVVWAYVRTADDNYRVSAPDLEANRWYHVVLVFDQTGNKLQLYVDGVLADQVVTAGALMSTSIPLRVGVGEQTATPNTVAFLADQLGIWDRVLSAADVEMLYNDELGKEDFTADVYGDNVSLLLHMDRPANAVGGSGGADSGDPYFNDVVLLLHFDGPDGSTTFTDSSPNALTVTANGNAQISTAQSKFGGASGYLGAPGDSLSLSAASLPIAVDEDFTIEAWIYLPTGVNFVELFGMDSKNYFIVEPTVIYFNGDNDPPITANYAFPTDVWQHVAVTRANNTLRVFVDGQIVHTASESKTYFTQSPTLTIGRQNDGGPSASSYIDDLRITKGVARYTANFTPPTAPFPSQSPDPSSNAVSLLLHFDGTDGSTTFTDSSVNALTVTAEGDAQISTAQSKFGGASGYFDGLSYVHADHEPLGADDFTIECWLFVLNVGGYDSFLVLGDHDEWAIEPALVLNFVPNSGTLRFTNCCQEFLTTNTELVFNSWTHVALVRQDGEVTFYVNGVAAGSVANSENFSSRGVHVGGWPYGGTSFTGYIDDLRITKGVARYTANFTPPTAAFPNPLADQYFNDVSLLLHMNGANNSTTFTDSSVNALTVTAEGDAQISTAQSKFGGASGYFAVAGDMIVVDDAAPFDFAAADFTIEFWLRLNGTRDIAALVHKTSYTAGLGFVLWIYDNNFGSTRRLTLMLNGTNYVLVTDEDAFADDVWTHIAVVRNGSTIKIYSNGVVIGSGEFSGSVSLAADSPFGIGSIDNRSWNQFTAFNGYIDDFRITKGVARYTANFTPPTAAFPDATGGGGVGPITTFIDSSKHNHELTAVGNAYLNLTDIKYGNGSGEFAGGHCTIPMSPEFAFDTGDFTVEFWGNLTYAANSAVFSIAPESEEAGTYLIGFRNDANMFGFCYDMPNFTFVSADISAYYGEWAHYAFVRLDGVLKMYVNGTQVGTANTTIDFDGGTQTTAVIGRRWVDVDDHYLAGLIDDLRITKGAARYIANFNPPTKAFPDPVLVTPPAPAGDIYAENVTLLLHMDGANGSTTFTDNSYLQNTVTAEGGAVISTAQSKWGGASLDVTQAGRKLLVDSAPAASLGSGDFTIECWLYWTGSISGFYTWGAIAATATAPNPGGWYFLIDTNTNNGVANALMWIDENSGFIPGNMSVPANEWCHVAVVRSGNNIRLYINGIAAGSGTSTTDIVDAGPVAIGADNGEAGYVLGYIDDLRITKGVARYTENFTPPTVPFPNPFVPGPTADLLLHFDGTNGSTTFTDSSPNALTVTANGNAQISTAQSKFGGASGYFDGDGDYLTFADPNFGSGDFTIEAWIYLTDIPSGYATLWANRASESGFGGALAVINGGNVEYFIASGGTGWAVAGAQSGLSVTVNQWHHIAMVRSGNAITLFVDGVAGDPATFSGEVYSSGDFSFMAGAANGPQFVPGYADELRIVKGTALYTADFTPPTAPFRATADVTPTDVTGCDLWLDSTGDIAESNGAILTWADKSGNGRTATPADYAPAPIVAAGDGPNGQDVVRFSGDPNVLDVSYQFNLKNSSGFILLGQTGQSLVSGWQRVLGFQPVTGLDSQTADGMCVVVNNYVSPYGLALFNDNTQHIAVTQTLPLPWTLISYTISATGEIKFRVNGEEVDSSVAATIANKAGGNLYIGHGGALATDESLQGDIAEIALFDHALGEAALIGLEQGIMKRWFPALAPPDAETILLLHFDGPNNTATFVDSSTPPKNISAETNSVVTSTQAKFGQSAYFNGAGYRVYTDASPVFDISAVDYTVEFWLYLNAVLPGDSARLFTFEAASGARIGMLLFQEPGDTLYRLGMNKYGVPIGFVTPEVVSTGQWTHIAFVRNGANNTLYVNGTSTTQTLVGGANWHEQVFVPANYSVSIGANTGNFSFYGLAGYIDEFRIVKGEAVYTGNFTPPTQPFGAANLLMHFDADTSDNSGNNVSVTNNGVTIDTITTKFGAGSAYFNGAAVSTLTTPDLPAFGFGTGDFTIEMFVKQELAGRNSVISIGTYQNGILWRLGPSTVDSLYLAYDAPGGNVWDWDTTASVPFNTWTHIALTRQNGTLRAFIDGVKVFEQTGVTVDLGASRPLMIGCGAHELGSLDAYHGHIDELRIIKGEAVYTGNFTPPTAPFI